MLVTTAPKTRIYAIGDVHGMAGKLSNLLAQIQTDADIFAGHKVLVMLGDYIDRGLHSRQVLETLSKLYQQTEWLGWEIVMLKGNHEFGCLTFIDAPETLPQWATAWGGETMLQSYGVPVAHSSKPTELRDKLMQRMPEHHLTFLRNLPLTYSNGDYLFVHAGVRAGVELSQQEPWDLMFIREPDFAPEIPHNLPYRIVYGHRPKAEPLVTFDRICIDTGAYKNGVLTAVVLENENVRFLSA